MRWRRRDVAIASRCAEASFSLTRDNTVEYIEGVDTFKYLVQMLDRSDDGPPEFWEGTPSMYSSGETAKEGGGGYTSFRNVLSGGGTGSINLWGEDLGLIGVDVPEYGGIARGLPKAYNRAADKAAEGRDLEKRGSSKGS